MKNHSARLLELDVLRGLAALSVLCFHYTTYYKKLYSPDGSMLFDFSLGGYAVQIFFMISGFVIFMTLEKTKKPLDFIVSRFSRLYPAYWAAVILTFAAVKFFPIYLPSGEIWRDVSFQQALVNLSMFQYWFGIDNIDGVYWTLSIELAFYFFIFLIYITGQLKFIEELGLAWLILMAWNQRLLWRWHIHLPELINTSLMLDFGHLFFAGILFYNLKTKGNAWYRHVALMLCLVVQYMIRETTPFTAEHPMAVTFVVAGCFVVFYLFVFDRLSWIVHKPLLFLGTISYTLYITHFRVGHIIIHHLRLVHANGWLCFFVPLAGAVLIASLITFGIEKPAMNWIRSVYRARTVKLEGQKVAE